jgi:hypothetical protein
MGKFLRDLAVGAAAGFGTAIAGLMALVLYLAWGATPWGVPW